MSDRETFWLDDVPASEAGVPACGDNPDRWYPTGCTRAAGHDGDHGHPNWSGRFETRLSRYADGRFLGGLEVLTRDSHQASSAVIRSREQGLALLAFLRDRIDERFPA